MATRSTPLGHESNRDLVLSVADPAGRFNASTVDFDYLLGDIDRDANPGDDVDHDGLTENGNGRDNCWTYPNPDQMDFDRDGIGDVCECPAEIAVGGHPRRNDGDDDGLL